MISAITMTYSAEAIGVARAAKAVSLPSVISFTGVLALSPASGWVVADTADFNGDGKTDLLIFNETTSGAAMDLKQASRIARLMALAIHFDRQIRAGVFDSYSDIARCIGKPQAARAVAQACAANTLAVCSSVVGCRS